MAHKGEAGRGAENNIKMDLGKVASGFFYDSFIPKFSTYL
jgi:hypothetical protein